MYTRYMQESIQELASNIEDFDMVCKILFKLIPRWEKILPEYFSKNITCINFLILTRILLQDFNEIYYYLDKFTHFQACTLQDINNYFV